MLLRGVPEQLSPSLWKSAAIAVETKPQEDRSTSKSAGCSWLNPPASYLRRLSGSDKMVYAAAVALNASAASGPGFLSG